MTKIKMAATMLSLFLATFAQGQLDFYDFLPEGEPTQFWI
jgi:hypothetical protein